ncbi:MAG: ADP-ribosylglycohydrolase family protein, partial [Clostridia bacterium]|nr:ADP-ribosylglycohydrolase family protein [Clostridia bacterium]
MNKKMLTYKEYYNKVFGSLLGKCVAGTIGAPYEGMKQLLNIKYDKSMIEKLLPNDDLDLQVLWLKVLEEKGVNFTSDDLAAAFSGYNVIWPGEYALFDKNYRRGLRPPYTAKYENGFYNQGMGCPIRGEIWGLICPLNPELATKLCVYDGVLDHEGESVYFEQFISAMISCAFTEDDIVKLVLKAKRFVKLNSRAEKLINDVLRVYRSGKDALYLRDYLLTEYGHSDCTNSFINIGITVFCLLKGGKNIIETVMTALNCGFDTDCTTGICGSVLGAIIGAESLILKEGFKDNGYKTMLNYQRQSDRISDLAADVCNMGLYFMAEHSQGVKCVEGESSVNIPKSAEKIKLSVDYPDGPFFEPDK